MKSRSCRLAGKVTFRVVFVINNPEYHLSITLNVTFPAPHLSSSLSSSNALFTRNRGLSTILDDD